jgi:microsomal dipeptidase-like Zn-dependent dipeptidase
MEYFVDIHAHSVLKPFGQSFSNGQKKTDKSSMWYYDPPRCFKKLFERVGLSAYSQADLTTCVKGKIKVVGVSLYPPEISFFKNRLGDNKIADGIENFITLFGKERIQYIQSEKYNYFDDLIDQYKYIQTFHDNLSDDGQYRSVIIKNSDDIDNAIKADIPTVAMFLNIEGAHAFGCGKPPISILEEADENDIIAHIDIVKNWEFKPLYVTMSHHFYNQVAGHAKSLPFIADAFARQETGMHTNITPFGKQIIRKLLNNDNGKRILIDIKHLSVFARNEFYEILDTDYKNEKIPIIYSHGGVTGQRSFHDILREDPQTLFNHQSINLYDDEIERIGISNGIIGLSFDERIMASDYCRQTIYAQNLLQNKTGCMRNWSKVIWNHIQYIAKILDAKGLYAWNHTCIGSDFDGVINPINYFLSEESMPLLKQNLRYHATQFMNDEPKLKNRNLLDPNIIVDKILYLNALRFIRHNL